MTLEESLKALKSAFSGKSAEAAALSSEISALKAKNETLAAEHATLLEKFEAQSAAVVERDALAAQVAELAKALASAEDAKVQASAEVVSVGKKAADIVAQAGAAPVEITPSEVAAKSAEDLWSEYCAMEPGKAKMAFYEKNRSAFIKLAGIK